MKRSRGSRVGRTGKGRQGTGNGKGGGEGNQPAAPLPPQPAAESSKAAEPMPLANLALLALGFSLWTGLVEEIPTFLASVGEVVVRLSPDFVWMTPLSNALFFFPAALGLMGLGRFRPQATSRPVVMGVFAGLTTLALGLVLERLLPLAVLILAVGVGVQVKRKTRAESRHGWMLPVAVVVGLAVVLGLSGQREWRDWSSRNQRRAMLPAPMEGAPNVLLLILDTVRGISLDFLSPGEGASEWDPVPTPALDGLARRSVVFTKAFAPSPWTLPSHASMFTGRWPNELSGGREISANWMGTLGPEYPTVAEVMARHGYSTGGFVGNLVFTSTETGLDRGFLIYRDYTVSFGQILLSSAMGRRLSANGLWRWIFSYHDTVNRKHAGTVTDEFLSWQDGLEDRPFFAFLNYFDAHEPFFPPDSLKDALPEGDRWDEFSHFVGLLTGATALRTEKWGMSGPERAAHAAGYHQAIIDIDREIQRLLEELQKRDLLDNTILIVASDHGEQLGEHGLYNHNNSLYLPLLHVPLVIRDPRTPAAPRRVSKVVSLRHMAATILDLAGVDAQSARIPGSSLARYWANLPDGSPAESSIAPDTAFALLNRGAIEEAWYPAVWGPTMYSLVDSTHHYVLNGDGTEELYDYLRDPAEEVDLAGDSLKARTVRSFRETLRTLAPNLPAFREEPTSHPSPPAQGGGGPGLP